MKKPFLTGIIISFLFAISILKAQTPVHISEYNNTTQGMPNFGNDMVDVDLYRGQPNINIPLFTLSERGLNLEIVLNYKSGGVKVNTPSQWTGQDWNLNLGKITRIVRGLQFDELDYLNAEGLEGSLDGECYPFPPSSWYGDYRGLQKGFFLTRDKLAGDNWKSTDNLKELLSKTTPNALGFRADYEPDIFNFNFFGHSGFFFMGQDGTWKIASKSNLKIIFDKNVDMFYGLKDFLNFNYPATCRIKTIGRFTIVDDRGFKYTFGDNNVRNIEMNLRNFYKADSAEPVYANSWNIVRVTDPNDVILYEFQNENGNNLHHYLINESRKYIRIPSEPFVGNYTNPAPVVHSNYSGSFSKNFYTASGILYLPSYPVSVRTFSGSKIDFISSLRSDVEYTDNSGNAYSGNSLYEDHWAYNNILQIISDNWSIYSNSIPFPKNNEGVYGFRKRKLDGIKLTSSSGKVINNVELKYSNATQRIFLYSIKNNEKTYIFNYNNANLLPPLLSNKTDMWGYYNNIPYKIQYGDNETGTYWRPFENNKFWELQVNIPYLYYGTLTEVYWPTGGKTTLQWESNSFTKRINPKNGSPIATNLPGGGVRIRSIISAEESREFLYNTSFDDMDNNISSGTLVYEPVYYDNSNKALEIVGILNNSGVTPSYPHNTYTGNITGINSKSIFEPAEVVYSSVFEKKNTGFTQYSFYDYNDVPDLYYPGILPDNNALGLIKNDKSLERGLLKRKDFYDNTQKILKREDYRYRKQNIFLGRGVSYDLFATNASIPYSPPTNYIIPPPCLFCITNASPYEIDYSDNLISEIFTTEFFKDGRNLQYFKKFYYQSPLDLSYSLIDKIEEYPFTYDLSKFKTTKFQYAVDFGTSDPPFTDLQAKNMVGIPLSITKYNEAQQPISRVETIYGKNSSTSNLLLPISIQNIKTGMAGYGEDSFVNTRVTYDMYDGEGRVLQYTDESGIPTSIIWGYNKSQPIAKIKGSTYNQVAAGTNISTLQNASNADIDTASENTLISLLDDLRRNVAFKEQYITTYTYDPLVGVTSITGPEGLREYYKYNAQNKLEKVVDADGKLIEEYKYHYKN
ncbi:hypothetical protein PFY10_07950 [Chryseobacterium daecheongense]|nr:hypothetical protein PFY10_07950 [Chryseobacterium daecheongense]